MSGERPVRIVGDLSDLPEMAEGPAHLVWWGNVGFMVIEGTAFLLAAGAYLYLRSESSAWPPAADRLPGLLWSTVFTIGLVASELPNLWVFRKARAKSEGGVRAGTLAMALIGALLLVMRGFEINVLSPPWYHDAYGSVVWMLMALHTSHLVTDLGETAVQSLWLYTHEVGDAQFADIEDNSNYWSFVVLAWLPIYFLIYWLPRLA